eukprot:CAMPEP_0117672884 /NCGR_PEP_ID=MMETSP0804-20121206/14162_1 /TAXON_ID=1074897 /ORGANISM="Tetraselmis astigmatica, Strain CCMP880" /LENGTH=403 /DNA_ID=CAMNT_0005481555 /DNA_START=64 /DNA_END=1276 /DNA_ORIENTATION=+
MGVRAELISRQAGMAPLLRASTGRRAPPCRAARFVSPPTEGGDSCASKSGEDTFGRRSLLIGSAALLSCTSSARFAYSAEATAPAEQVEKVYFGNGCFWGRQKDYVDVEMSSLGRQAPSISAVAGYAGGPFTSRDGRVCYYYAPPETEYERLGHAEAVGVELRGSAEDRKAQMREFARVYFKQFRRTPFGMQRQDPQDEGPGYRNIIGVPGGMSSPLMEVIKEENINRMEMMPGKGNLFDRKGFASEDDVLNRIYVMDSNEFGFHPAEVYHQFHNGLGKGFPKAYTQELKTKALEAGVIKTTGCPENPFGINMSPFEVQQQLDSPAAVAQHIDCPPSEVDSYSHLISTQPLQSQSATLPHPLTLPGCHSPGRRTSVNAGEWPRKGLLFLASHQWWCTYREKHM